MYKNSVELDIDEMEEELEPTEENLNEIETEIMGEYADDNMSDITDVSDDIGIYIKQISAYPLCTQSEEVQYFKKIREGETQNDSDQHGQRKMVSNKAIPAYQCLHERILLRKRKSYRQV